jgi:carbon-monoxide dehydrogenase iron sulfur subunit
MEQPACVASCPTGALVYGDEETYIKVLTAKRGNIAVYITSVPTPSQSHALSLDFSKKDK